MDRLKTTPAGFGHQTGAKPTSDFTSLWLRN